MPVIRDVNANNKDTTEEKNPSTTPKLDSIVAAAKDSKTGQGKEPTAADIKAAADDLTKKEDAGSTKKIN